MKGILKFLIGVALGGLLGWGLGFLRFPSMEKNYSFWVGFLACLALVLFLLGVAVLWVRHRRAINRVRRYPSPGDVKGTLRPYVLVWILLGLMVLGGGIGVWVVREQNSRFDTQLQAQELKMEEQAAVIMEIRGRNAGTLMNEVLVSARRDLEADDSLTANTIARISALAYALQPYRYIAGDSLAVRKLSPERGQLLLALVIMGLDTGSFGKVKRGASFSGADLSGANLQGADLSGADLNGASLKDADLTGANLSRADVRAADAWGAILNQARLDSADLRRADLRWAELNAADLRGANLNGVDLTSAKLRKADLRGAMFQYAKCGEALLNEADMTGIDLFGTFLPRATLEKTNLSQANLQRIDMSDAHLVGTVLDSARVDENWPEMFADWHVTGEAELNARYQMVSDTTRKYQYARFMMQKTDSGR